MRPLIRCSTTRVDRAAIATLLTALAAAACQNLPSSTADPPTSSAAPIGRLAAFKDATPAQYGIGDEPALTRFLFDLEGVPDASVVGRVAQRFEWDEGVARLATFASLERAIAWSERVSTGSTSRNEAVEAALWQAVDQAPRSWPLYEELADFYGENFDGCHEAGLRRVVEHWGDVRDAVRRVGSIVTECPELALTALQRYPDDLGVLTAVAHRFDHTFSSEWPISLAVRRRAVELAEEQALPPGSQRDGIAASYLDALLAAGAVDTALAFYDGLDGATRARLLDLEVSPSGFPRGRQKISGRPGEAFRLELAASLALRGRVDEANAIRPAPRDVEGSLDARDYMSGPRQSATYSSGLAACLRVLDAALGPSGEDPFSLLIDVGGFESFGHGEASCRHNATWRALLVRMADGAGYASMAAWLEEDDTHPLSASTFEYFAAEHGSLLGRLPPSLVAHYRAIERELRLPGPESRAWVARAPGAEWLRARIDVPDPAPFEERSLPDDVPRQVSLAEEIEAWLASEDALDAARPSDTVREDRRGDVVARVSANQAYDPMGEVGVGGYWLHLSHDGGETWAPPVYTGLRSRFPYVVRRDSALAILDRDRVQLEVAIDEVETRSITFPPLGLASKRQSEGLYVTAPLASLTRDTDGDGLTDLAEHALVLDPNRRDSDGDGLEDGRDALPHVAFQPGGADRSAALAAALPAMFGAGLRAHVIAPQPAGETRDSGLRHAMGTQASPGNDWTLFLVADRRDFRPLQLDKRVVVLTPEEAEAIGERRGVFYPAWITLFELDAAGENAVLVWSASWTGGTLRLRKIDGVWSAEVTSSWIT